MARLPNLIPCFLKRCRSKIAEQRPGQDALFILETMKLVGRDISHLACGQRYRSIRRQMLAAALQDVQELITARMAMMLVHSTRLEGASPKQEVIGANGVAS